MKCQTYRLTLHDLRKKLWNGNIRVNTFVYVIPTGLLVAVGTFSIGMMSLTGQNANGRMKDVGNSDKKIYGIGSFRIISESET